MVDRTPRGFAFPLGSKLAGARAERAEREREVAAQRSVAEAAQLRALAARVALCPVTRSVRDAAARLSSDTLEPWEALCAVDAARELRVELARARDELAALRETLGVERHKLANKERRLADSAHLVRELERVRAERLREFARGLERRSDERIQDEALERWNLISKHATRRD